MFLRSKIQEMILKRRSRSMNSAQQGHVSSLDQLASPSMIRYDNSGNSCSGGSSNSAHLSSACPRLLHSSSLPTGSVVFGKNNNPAPDAESETTTAFSASPISVLDAAASSFASSGSDAVVVGKRRRPWRAREGLHGLADALDCTDDEQQERGVVLAATSSPSLLVRSCSLDRRVEFGVKNKSSWLPLRETAAASPSEPRGETDVMIEPSSEDYTCVICRGPNPRTVHIFGDRVVEGGAERESPPRPNNSRPPRGEGTTFLSL